MAPSEIDRSCDIRLVRALDDERRSPVNHAVEDAAGFVVAFDARRVDVALDLADLDGLYAGLDVRDLESKRGTSRPATDINTAPATGGQNAGGILPVASTSMPADSGPRKASR